MLCHLPLIACAKAAAVGKEVGFSCFPPFSSSTAAAADPVAAAGLPVLSALSGTEAEVAVAGVSSPLDFGSCRASSSLEQQPCGISGSLALWSVENRV